MNDINKRVEGLEDQVKILRQEVKILKNIINKRDKDIPWQSNVAEEYMIKLVYPDIFCRIDKPSIGFPSNRKKVAEEVCLGNFMFLYATTPEKKIIGLTKVIDKHHSDDSNERWPYQNNLEWVINPKPGVTFKDVGLDIRPRPGDTVYGITYEKAQEIIDLLNKQSDLDSGTLKYLSDKYSAK